MNVNTFTPKELLLRELDGCAESVVEDILRYTRNLKFKQTNGSGLSDDGAMPRQIAIVMGDLWNLPQEDDAWRHL